MKKIFLLSLFLCIGVVTNAQYKVSLDGNAYIEKTVLSKMDIVNVKQILNDVLSENAIYGGRILSTEDNSVNAQYILKTVKRANPISIDANSVISIRKENDSISVRITLYEYQKFTGFGNTGLTIPIKDTKPLNPKGKNFGFLSGQIKDAFSKSVVRINEILNIIIAKIETKR